MVLAARFSARRGLMGAPMPRASPRTPPPWACPPMRALGLNVSGAQLAAHMLHDKKVDAGRLAFLLMRGIGQTFLTKDVTLDEVSHFLAEELGG
jgi:3-dehydroquinate synthase